MPGIPTPIVSMSAGLALAALAGVLDFEREPAGHRHRPDLEHAKDALRYLAPPSQVCVRSSPSINPLSSPRCSRSNAVHKHASADRRVAAPIAEKRATIG
jgi:hypothetical protein